MLSECMGGKRYHGEFKIEVVKHIVDRGHSIISVITRLDFNPHRLNTRVKSMVLINQPSKHSLMSSLKSGDF